MTIEEKAKAYDEAFKEAEKIHKFSSDIAEIKRMEQIFPKLKESEDELTWLTKYIEEEAYSLSIDIRDNEDRIKLKKLQKALAWLEKQGEQKPAEWSEDDNEHAESILERLEDMCNKDSTFYHDTFCCKPRY